MPLFTRRRRRASSTDRFAVLIRRLRWPVAILWFVMIVLLNPVAGGLSKATNDTPAAYLPHSASSTKVAEIEEAAAGGKGEPQTDDMVIIFERKTGLTEQDSTVIAAARTAVAGLVGTTAGLTAPGDVTVSDDKQAAVFGTGVTAPQQDITDDDAAAVKAVRDALDKATASTSGLQVAVTGAAAATTDSGNETETGLLLSAVIIVGIVLLLVYRSPVLWALPLIGAGGAVVVAQAGAHGLASAGLTISSLSTSILIVLVFGAGTDYALLLTHRYREELSLHALPEDAMSVALRRTLPTLLASAGTVVAAMLCLLAAGSGAVRGLGPVGVVGVLAALVAEVTFYPALLLIFGRVAFWPRVPREGKGGHEESRFWARIGNGVARRPAPVTAISVVLLIAACAGLFALNFNSDPLNNVKGNPGSVVGTRLISQHFPVGISYPLVILTPPDEAAATETTARGTPNVSSVEAGPAVQGYSSFSVVLSVTPFGDKAWDTIKQLRSELDSSAPKALVGGFPAVQYDSEQQARHDATVVIPLVLLVILIVIGLLLRAVVAPIVLVVTTALSFAASFGLASLLWKDAFGFDGIDPSIPIYIFVFLVALGVDYNIFLAARIREESRHLGTKRGTLRGLSVTGGVITAAGVVLAATFAALAQLPSVQLTEVGSAVALGVLLDTLLVRTVLVPASILTIGDKSWWPSREKLPSSDEPASATEKPASEPEPEPESESESESKSEPAVAEESTEHPVKG
ncbi:MMPL family transporter [Winogradskya humida]|uniref:Membrane protein ActII-3 n=1 Tax=Winogradskya humida TaxID=113566 RepID=A0ABQ4A5L3_9ACTN|nr:MMPL family transporter [Actinoplanes humidus]GIE26128.1 putative membrane protein ActII-3 [Actinoplanes humidus]